MIKKFTADTSELKTVISCMKSWLENHSIHQNICEKCHIICEEVFTNTALYAFSNSNKSFQESDSFIVRQNDHISVEFIYIDNETISLIFSDTGTPFDLVTYYKSSSEKGISSMGGMGVRIIIQMSDSVNYKRRNNRNILSIKLCKD